MDTRRSTVLLREMGCFGSEEFGAEIAWFMVCVAALAWLSIVFNVLLVWRSRGRIAVGDEPDFEEGVCWEKTLVVGWAALGFFASGLVFD